MPDQIFKATYSGVPVYEMMSKSVAVMRRRADSWLNATQILKVAGFDKPQRTRILERDVQKDEHEKVQGGYGKYQGTWVPMDRGLALARQYNVEHLLRPIIDFQPTTTSPPPAPKHLNAPAKPKRRDFMDFDSLRAGTTSRKRGSAYEESPHSMSASLVSEEGSITTSPTGSTSTRSHTPSPLASPRDNTHDLPTVGPSHARRRTNKDTLAKDSKMDYTDDRPVRSYVDQILEYFITDTKEIPDCLVSPPPDFDANMKLDDDGHTPLHWAAAMGRVRVVKLLVTAGAEPTRTNNVGQTPLMRSVMFANNYDVRKFPEVYEVLNRTTLHVDQHNRTVFHHVLDLALTKGKTHAARYYLETILSRLKDYPKELADVINWQDEDGETALTMAARCRSKRLVKLLLDYGADPKQKNNDGKSTEDYILEDERFRQSPLLPSRAHSLNYRVAQAQFSAAAPYANQDKLPLHYSSTGQRASTRCINDMATMLSNLAQSFDAELLEKERDLTQASALLQNIQTEIMEGKRTIAALQQQTASLNDNKEKLAVLEEKLVAKMEQHSRLGWARWVAGEEARDQKIRAAAAASAEEASSSTTTRRKGGEDLTDIQAMYDGLPKDPDAIRAACAELREQIQQKRARQKDLFRDVARAQAETGTDSRMADYKRLVAAGCGGISTSEVEAALPSLLDTLQSEESGQAWRSPAAATVAAPS